jgi:hypothetical protein
MKTRALILSLCISPFLFAPLAHAFQLAAGQSVLPVGDALSPAADPAAGSSSDDSGYADGVRAINAGQWTEAIAIFTRVAAQSASHADGALYWKAYAENKEGQSETALNTCGSLRRDHPGSSWLEECGALEIEIRAKSGQPVPPKAEQNDDLKLLALASLMQRDEKKALAQIDQILNTDASSEKLKQGALFIMGEHHSDTIYPQIARLSFVDGDVRIERGQQDGHRKDITWEAAASGVPLESGYSIVTGDGRAEIELENASTLYLAPNSVLTVNDLSTVAGIPRTDLALLSGTLTLHVHPYVPGEVFLLRTPTDNLLTKYPSSSNLRLTSYLDGVAIAGLDKSVLSLGANGSNQLPMPLGQTFYFKDGRRILDAGPTHPDDFSGWDQWVATRYITRTTALEEMTKAAGLTTPLPGIADMEGKGRFFSCEPYGTCWEPNPAAATSASNTTPAQGGATQASTEVAERAVAETSAPQTSTAGRNIQFIGRPAASGPPTASSDMDPFFPCIPGEVRSVMMMGAFPTAAQFHEPAWAWAVCHSGSWIYQGNHYVWVAGHRHHRPCVQWIKDGHTVAFVPIHPHDVKDQLPVNRKAPVFVVNPKNGHSVERASLDSTRPVELLRDPPKEFRSVALMPLPRAADPHMEGHQLRNTLVAKGSGAGSASGSAMRPNGIPITFDHHSQNFVIPNHAIEGNHLSTGFTPITNASGSLQSHSGAMTGGGFHGGYGGGGGYHGGTTVSSSSGGSSHSNGSSSSSSSAPASSAASSVSASSGAHK